MAWGRETGTLCVTYRTVLFRTVTAVTVLLILLKLATLDLASNGTLVIGAQYVMVLHIFKFKAISKNLKLVVSIII